MSLGPIEVLLIAFPGNQFNGEILPELERLVETETISVVDGLFVAKAADGEVVFAEFGEEDAGPEVERLSALLGEATGMLSDNDVMELAEGLEPESSAALLVFEHNWAKPFRDAIVGSGGVVAADFRVPGLVVDQVLDELAASE